MNSQQIMTSLGLVVLIFFVIGGFILPFLARHSRQSDFRLRRRDAFVELDSPSITTPPSDGLRKLAGGLVGMVLGLVGMVLRMVLGLVVIGLIIGAVILLFSAAPWWAAVIILLLVLLIYKVTPVRGG